MKSLLFSALLFGSFTQFALGGTGSSVACGPSNSSWCNENNCKNGSSKGVPFNGTWESTSIDGKMGVCTFPSSVPTGFRMLSFNKK